MDMEQYLFMHLTKKGLWYLISTRLAFCTMKGWAELLLFYEILKHLLSDHRLEITKSNKEEHRNDNWIPHIDSKFKSSSDVKVGIKKEA